MIGKRTQEGKSRPALAGRCVRREPPGRRWVAVGGPGRRRWDRRQIQLLLGIVQGTAQLTELLFQAGLFLLGSRVIILLQGAELLLQLVHIRLQGGNGLLQLLLVVAGGRWRRRVIAQPGQSLVGEGDGIGTGGRGWQAVVGGRHILETVAGRRRHAGSGAGGGTTGIETGGVEAQHGLTPGFGRSPSWVKFWPGRSRFTQLFPALRWLTRRCGAGFLLQSPACIFGVE